MWCDQVPRFYAAVTALQMDYNLDSEPQICPFSPKLLFAGLCFITATEMQLEHMELVDNLFS